MKLNAGSSHCAEPGGRLSSGALRGGVPDTIVNRREEQYVAEAYWICACLWEGETSIGVFIPLMTQCVVFVA